MELSAREFEFLDRIQKGQRPRLADREEDKARQRVRRLGLAKVVMGPRRWVLTESGLAHAARSAKT